MGQSELKTDYNERKFIIQAIIQYHKAVQPYTAISWLAKALSSSQLTLEKAASKRRLYSQTWQWKFDGILMKPKIVYVMKIQICCHEQ